MFLQTYDLDKKMHLYILHTAFEKRLSFLRGQQVLEKFEFFIIFLNDKMFDFYKYFSQS